MSCPQLSVLSIVAGGKEAFYPLSGSEPEASGILHENFTESYAAAFFRLVSDGIFLAEILGFDDDVGHRKKGEGARGKG